MIRRGYKHSILEKGRTTDHFFNLSNCKLVVTSFSITKTFLKTAIIYENLIIFSWKVNPKSKLKVLILRFHIPRKAIILIWVPALTHSPQRGSLSLISLISCRNQLSQMVSTNPVRACLKGL